ncbi:lysophospholipid acyltransferase family protein [Rhizobium sp. NXC24]|uniref:lysophospholipid acyltransferase family protein n=1 Tax=Rhizobium sp. NXC24 TaxID=2048897 RepID=UPI000CF1FFC7|nr:lysophospholipid acyltransferase family protein [Rhizobium sp. NXC24]
MTASLLSYANDKDHFAKRMAIRGIETALGRRAVEKVFERWRVDVHGVSQHPFGRILEMYGIDFRIKGEWPLRKIPDGPIVMVANHPFGVADGMALGAIAEHFGRPYRVIVNERMMKVPEFRPYILPISFDETAEAMEVNLSTRNEAIRLLRDGVTIGIFPSGGVATAPRGFGPAEELPWKMFLAKLIQMGKANVLPIFIEGQNSLLFQMMSRVSPTVRLALLFNEFHRLSQRSITARVDCLMPWSELAAIRDRKAVMDHIQERVIAMRPYDRRRLSPAALRAQQQHWLWREGGISTGSEITGISK